jgi:hypothetical protein
MEITHLTFLGVPIMTLLAIWGVFYMIRTGVKDWGEQRALKKELDEAHRALHEKYRWEPDMSTGSDQGKWVRKDGLPDYD